MIKLIRCAVVVLMLTPTAVAAQDYDAGEHAYKAGDYKTALREWRPLAEQGDVHAQYQIGLMYANGEGVAQDHVEAVRWYRLAAEQGHVEAQYKLGVRYSRGLGVMQDYTETARWHRLAAEQGHAHAQGNLGALYSFGRGVLQDDVTAHMWFNIAAANGSELAVQNRDGTAERMTAGAIAEAQQRARTCMVSGYQDCD